MLDWDQLCKVFGKITNWFIDDLTWGFKLSFAKLFPLIQEHKTTIEETCILALSNLLFLLLDFCL